MSSEIAGLGWSRLPTRWTSSSEARVTSRRAKQQDAWNSVIATAPLVAAQGGRLGTA
jgi:hypothetical protein